MLLIGVKGIIKTVIDEWLEEERGNRVTSNNVQGMLTKISIALSRCDSEEEPIERAD